VPRPREALPFSYLDDVVTAPFGEGLVVVRRTGGQLGLLNSSGALVWRLYHGGAEIEGSERAAHGLVEAFGIGPEEAADAVASSLVSWRASGLLDAPDGAAVVEEAAPSPAWPVAGTIERAYRLGDGHFRIGYGTSGLMGMVHPRLEHLQETGHDGSPLIEVLEAGEGFVVTDRGHTDTAGDLSGTIGLLFRRIVEVLHPRTRWIAHLHSAAVRLDGSTLLLAGGKGIGKSTLTAALLHAGAAYLSDDVVFLDERCRAVPLPVRLALKEGSWPVVASLFPELLAAEVSRSRTAPVRYLTPASPVGGEGGSPEPPKALLFPRYLPAAPAVLRAIPPEEALVRLVEDRTWFSREESDVRAWAAWLARVPAWSLEYGSLRDALPLVREAAGAA
jgi:hypothetical protein